MAPVTLPQLPLRALPLRALPLRALVLVAAAAALLLAAPAAEACTRVVYTGANATVVTGRTMDWQRDQQNNLWAMPRGVARDGAAGDRSFKWTAKYGSVVTSMYEMGTVDGINEAGLVANTLYLAESDYGSSNGKPLLTIAAWAQYALDTFATAAEAAAALRAEPFRIVAPVMPDGRAAQGHLALSDAGGGSAIFEYLNGTLVIHEGKQYKVMTNSPSYDKQLAIEAYWRGVGGAAFLPGTSRAPDRFARASYLLSALPTTVAPALIAAVPNQSFENQAAASVRSIMQAVSVPFGTRLADPSAPNIASTLWRTIADSKRRIYYFDSASTPNTFWVKLADLDLKAGAPIRKLTLTGGRVYAGNAAAQFEPAAPFKFLAAKAR